MATKPWKGVIERRHPRIDSRLGTVRTAQGASRRTERAVHRVGRHRLWRAVAVRRPHRGAKHEEARRRRAEVQPVPHDRAVLANTRLDADRAQSHHCGHGVYRRSDHRLSRVQRAHPLRDSAHRRSARARRATIPTCWASGTAVPRTRPTWPPPSATGPRRGFERYYGFLGGETNQWYPDLVQDQQFAEQPAEPPQGLAAGMKDGDITCPRTWWIMPSP